LEDIVFTKLPDDLKPGDTITVAAKTVGEGPRGYGVLTIERADH
jgi:hypothetical protein